MVIRILPFGAFEQERPDIRLLELEGREIRLDRHGYVEGMNGKNWLAETTIEEYS